MNKALKITLTIILFAIVFIAIIIGVKFAYDTYINSSYPLKYEDEVYSARLSIIFLKSLFMEL